ncbi:MAG TPA: type II toxin-antitoxin system VapC family toxin [Geminicoccaceae bacterium]|nr:type II toxin-antitoxin system VapC family toxin [Geminicoccaceae bacterium]
MVIDTSVIVAILFGEAEAEAFAEAIEAAPVRAMSMASALEATIVIESELGPEGGRELDALLHTTGISIEPVTTEQLAAARHAFRNFDTGRHPAALNFGDCFGYALIKSTGEPLLFKGQDFAQTDVDRALPI